MQKILYAQKVGVNSVCQFSITIDNILTLTQLYKFFRIGAEKVYGNLYVPSDLYSVMTHLVFIKHYDKNSTQYPLG